MKRLKSCPFENKSNGLVPRLRPAASARKDSGWLGQQLAVRSEQLVSRHSRKSSPGEGAGEADEVSPGRRFGGAEQCEIEVLVRGVGEENQAGTFHGVEVLVTHRAEVRHFAAGSEFARQGVHAAQP